MFIDHVVRCSVLKLFVTGFGLLLLSGCSSRGVIDNAPLTEVTSTASYSVKAAAGSKRGSGGVSLILSFSGGGTRAAALAYGVMKELRVTTLMIDGKPRKLLDEVDFISSVSGGSFTSAYYGVYGDRIFEDYEDVFLRRNIQSQLIRGLFNPLTWLGNKGRTEMAVKIYDKEVFHGATFGDMQRKGGPLVLINASDLGHGVRFSFVQEYFTLLCSDISSFPVAKAVAASSAVPVVFPPVVVKNHKNCKRGKPDWLLAAEKRTADDPVLSQVVDGLQSYDKERRQFAHFVDGGITDNLGLRAVYEMIEMAGGANRFVKHTGRKRGRSLMVISVNASTEPEPKMDTSGKSPSLMESLGAMTNVQLQRYNAATLKLMDESLTRWAKEISTPASRATPYFVQVGFKGIKDPQAKQFFNQVPTSFSLSEEQVNRLIEAGRELLRNNPDYQRFLKDHGGART